MKTCGLLFTLAAWLLLCGAAMSQPPNGEEFIDPTVDHFWIAIETTLNPTMSGGAPVNDPGEDGQWLLYTTPAGVPWYNIWFYDDPFDSDRMKRIRMGFWILPFNPGQAGQLFYVVNWSAPDWDPAEPGYPTPNDEAYILRSETNGPITIPPALPPPGIWIELFYEIPDYNPEWVSVDIFGLNIIIVMEPIPPPLESPLYPWWDGGPGGTIVHECLALQEFGDAPEGAVAYLGNNQIGNFPTCTQVGPVGSFIKHGCPNALFFGGMMDCEIDGNAGLCPVFEPNWYNMDECGTWPYPGYPFPPPPPVPPPPPNIDEGLFLPNSSSIVVGQYVSCGSGPPVPIDTVCKVATWGTDVDIFINGGQAIGGFLNVLFDWNRDGFWANDPNTTCQGNMVPEHVLVDFPVPVGFMGPASFLNPPAFTVGPKSGFVWARFTLTEQPVGDNWHGAGVFADGETEDYLINVAPVPVIPVSNWAILLAAFLIIGFIAFLWRKNH